MDVDGSGRLAPRAFDAHDDTRWASAVAIEETREKRVVECLVRASGRDSMGLLRELMLCLERGL
jgi:hypothetical protein